MWRRYRFIIGSLVIISLALATTLTSQARSTQESAVQKGNGVTAKVISQADQRAAQAMWTREAIAAAQPIELPAQAGPAEVDSAAISDAQIGGSPVRLAGGLAARDAEQVARAAYPKDWAAFKENVAPTGPAAIDDIEIEGTSQIYTSYMVNKATALQNLYPHIWIGRLSFSTPGGTSYCSGTSISGNVMVTAAHCVYDSTNNRWYSNWVFAPAYRNGSAPYGTFAATTCWVLNTWINLSGSYSINTWAPHDVAVCRMGTNSAGRTLNSAVGWSGRQWNWPYARHYHDLGYPFNDYNNAVLPEAGLYLRTCVAESFQQTTETRGMGCNLGGGISGGPWMIGYAPNVASGAVDGVNSGIFIGTQNIYAGRFNSNNIVPLCTAAGC